MDAEDLETAPLLQPPQLPTTVRLDIQSKKKIIKSEFLWTYWKSRSLRRHWVYQAAALVALLLSLSLMLAVTTVLLILRDRAQNGHKDIIIDVGGDRGRGEAQNNISGRSSIWETDEVQLPATSENPLPVGSIAVAVPSLICRNLSEDIVNIKGGSTVDAAIVAVLCSGLINSYASGVGGGAFMVIQPSIVSHEDEEQRRKLLVVDDDHDPQAGRGVFEKTDPVMIDCRETAPERSWATMFKENVCAIEA